MENTIFRDELPNFIIGHKTGSDGVSISNIVVIGERDSLMVGISVVGAKTCEERKCVLNKLVDNKNIEGWPGGFLYFDYDNDTVIYAHNERKKFRMMSTTKLLTCITAIEHGLVETGELTICQTDITRDVDSELRSGDIMTYQNAVGLMLVPSNNTVSNAIARTIGKKIFWKTISERIL